MSASPKLRPVDKMQMRLMREAGVEVTECASYYGVSVATAMRALKKQDVSTPPRLTRSAGASGE